MRRTLLGLALVACLTACSKDDPAPNTTPRETTSPTTAAKAPTADEVFAEIYSEALGRCTAVARLRLEHDGTVTDLEQCTADLLVELTADVP